MKKLALAFFAAFGFSITAQTYSISPSKVVTFTVPFSNLTINDVYQVNTANSKILLKWERVSVNLPADWGYSMCDLGHCNSGIPQGPNVMDSVPVGGQGFLGLNIDPGTTSGYGVVKVRVYQQGFINNADTITWFVSTGATGITENSLDKKIVFYPNPFQQYLNVESAETQLTSLYVTDVCGRIVYRKENPSSSMNLDLSTLDRGTYLLHLYSGQEHSVKRILKD